MLTSESRAMIITNAVFMVVSGLAVILRIYARKQKAVPLAADDYLIVAAWAFSAALAITNIVGVPVGGFGVPFESLSEEKAVNFLKILFVLQFWYIIAVALVKLSILAFYGRVFSAGSYPLAIKIIIGLTIGWFISFLFATFFQVWPLWCNWIACTPTTNYSLMYVLCSVTDIILDISILCLPISFIRKLHMRRSQKIGITGIFGLGIFCVVSSIARLAYAVGFFEVNIVGNYAINFNTAVVNIIMWSGIEACASTICANLPCYHPLVGKARGVVSLFASFRSKISAHSSSYLRSRRSNKLSQNTTASAENILDDPPGVHTVIERGTTPRTSERDMEMGKINVKTTMDAREDNW